MRCDEPTCGAARPTPGAAYIVCVMLSMKLASLPSMFCDFLRGLLQRGFGIFENSKQCHWCDDDSMSRDHSIKRGKS